MKKILICLAMAVSLNALWGQAPDFSTKPGKVTDYELKLKRYDTDTTAHAVVLYENTDFRYEYSTSVGFFQLECYYEVKIKVLDDEGASWGDVAISYYDGGHGKREVVSRITATSYNLEGNKTVAKSVGRKEIHKEEVSENRYLTKFSIPDVKAGTVLEYSYRITSDFYYDMPVLRFQRSIPIRYKEAKVSVPEYFDFAYNTKGYNRIDRSTSRGNGRIDFQENGVVNYSTDEYKFTVENISALKDEPFVWSKEDFASAVEFELRSTRFPGSLIKTYSNTWETVNKRLSETTSFTSGLNFNNPYKQEVADIMSGEGDEYAKLAAVHKLVMSRLAWDEYYGVTAKNIRETLKTGVGRSSDLNFVLHSAVKDAGYKTEIVLLNPRRFGRIPLTRPSLEKINAFLVMVTMSDGKRVFIDATDRDSGLNVIPERLMVDRARIYGIAGENGWVDLTSIAPNRASRMITGSIDESGLFTGKLVAKYDNATSLDIKSKYRKAKSEDEYLEDMEESLKINITGYTIEGLDTNSVTESVEFTYQAETAGDKIYLRPTILPFMSSNPFTLSERMLPVEFSYPVVSGYNISIILPEGMVAEEVPANAGYANADKTLRYISLFQKAGSVLSSRNTFERNRILFPVTEYEDVYAFFGTVADANQRRIVISKQ